MCKIIPTVSQFTWCPACPWRNPWEIFLYWQVVVTLQNVWEEHEGRGVVMPLAFCYHRNWNLLPTLISVYWKRGFFLSSIQMFCRSWCLKNSLTKFDCLHWGIDLFVCRDDDSDDEIDDQDIHKIMIVTQTPPPVKKHDRTGSYVTRVKMTQELSKAINDGLYYYEQVWKYRFSWVNGQFFSIL